MSDIASEPNDFVSILGSLTNFVENERVRAYNDGVDMMLGQTKKWMQMSGMLPRGDNLTDLLVEIEAQVAARHRSASAF
jgi:hypothetical protein